MTHPLIIQACGEDPRARSDRPYPGLHSWLSDLGGLTTSDLLDAADEVRELIDLARAHFEPEMARDLADAVADWHDLLDLAQKGGEDQVPVFAVVSTYDPKGMFSPGRRVTRSGHFDRADAEVALAAWITRLNRPNDPMVIEEQWPTPLHSIKAAGWKGPGR